MPAQHTYAFVVEVDGAELPDDVADQLTSVVVDDSLHVPDMFVLTFRDPDRLVITKGKFKVAGVVKVSVVSPETTAPEHLVTGEITALEAEYDAGGTTTVVRGLDHSHRLFRGRANATYQNVTASDVARKVAQRAGVRVGRVDATPPVLPYVAQANQTDWAFLRRLAADNGMVMAVVEGKLDFRRPRMVSEAPAPGDLESQDDLQLTVGTNVLHLRATVTSAQQAAEVQVRAWDPKDKKAVVATAPVKASGVDVGVQPAALARKFGGAAFVVSQSPYKLQGEADAAAKAVAEEIGGAFAEVTGTAIGNTRLAAGAPVSIGLMGDPFDGRYTCTSTRHLWDPDNGYTTDFTVSGRQERSLLSLASSGGTDDHRMPGPVFGIVTDAKDPEKLGRVKVQLPTFGADFETSWAEVVYPGAGTTRGLFLPPEVNDQVLVAFELGDPDRPFVLGGVYNSRARPPVPGYVDGTSGAVNSRVLRSRVGNRLVLEDKVGATQEIGLHSADDKMLVQLLTSGQRIVKIVCDQDVVVDAGKNVTVKARGNVNVEATANASVKATGNLDLKGAMVKIEATGMMELKGSVIKLN